METIQASGRWVYFRPVHLGKKPTSPRDWMKLVCATLFTLGFYQDGSKRCAFQILDFTDGASCFKWKKRKKPVWLQQKDRKQTFA